MHIRLKENTVNFATPMLNSKPIIITIVAIEKSSRIEIISSVEHEISTVILQLVARIDGTDFIGSIQGLSNSITIDLTELDVNGDIIKENKAYSTIAISLLKEKIKSLFGLTDLDIEILSSLTWDADQIIYPVRVTFPNKEILTTYLSYVANEQDKPQVDTIDGVTLYIKEILPEHDFIRNDTNLLIEE